MELGNAMQMLDLHLPQKEEENGKQLYSRIYQLVCRFCSKKSWCWEDEASYTMESLAEACNLLEERGLSTETSFSSRFQGRCHRTGQLELVLLNQIEQHRQNQTRMQMQQEFMDNISRQILLLGEQMQQMRENHAASDYPERLLIGHACGKKEQVSGDSWGVLDLEDGRMVQILCDGMGSGELAMQQSRMAVQLLQILLAGGLSVRLSQGIINTVLSFQYGGVRFSTMDIAVWNLNSRQLELYKYGSAPSFVKNGRTVTMYDGESLPVGILPRVEADVLEHPITEGDLLIMMSDGMYELNSEGFQWEHIIRCMPTSNPQLVAEYIMAIAASRIRSNQKKEAALHPEIEPHTDDMTVLVSRLM